jgi:hypothetical protein
MAVLLVGNKEKNFGFPFVVRPFLRTFAAAKAKCG